jgi:RecA-family ATPase
VIKRIADDEDISIVIAHHTKKGSRKEDFIDKANGTTGVVAGADTILIIERESVLNKNANDVQPAGSVMAKLKISSRDFDEYCYDLAGKEGGYKWTLEGMPRLANREKKIYHLLVQNNNGLTADEIQAKTDMKTDEAGKILENLVLKNYPTCYQGTYLVKKLG